MAGPSLALEGYVLEKRGPTDASQGFVIFSATAGLLPVWQRLSRKSRQVALDLFDEAALQVRSGHEGRTHFVEEARVLARPSGIGRSYGALQCASALARLVLRNPVHEDSRRAVAGLLGAALGALDRGERADIVYFKSLYRFLRDEGYPAKEEWFAGLPAADRAPVAAVLNRPLAEQTAGADAVRRWRVSLEQYVRGATEIVLLAVP